MVVVVEIQSWSSGRPTLHGLQPNTPETAVLGDRAVHGDVDEVERRLDGGERVGAIAPELGGTPRTIRNAGLPLALTRSRERRLALLADRQQHVDDRLNARAVDRRELLPLGKFDSGRGASDCQPSSVAGSTASSQAGGKSKGDCVETSAFGMLNVT